jgi:hypothetical protein
MAESPVYDLLHAYALGCLNKNDFSELKKYFRSGQSFEWAELGEYQNLSALLPSILNIDNPPVQLKDKVARKLYRMRDQRRKTLTDLHKITQLSAKSEKDLFPPQVSGDAPELEGAGFARVTGERMADSFMPKPEISADDLERIVAQSQKDFSDTGMYQTKFELDPSEIDNWKEPELPHLPEAAPPAQNVIIDEPLVIPPAPPVHEPVVEKPEAKPLPQNPILERLSGGQSDFAKEETSSALYEEKSRKGIWTTIILLLVLVLALGAGGYYLYMLNLKNSKDIENLRQQINLQSSKSDATNEITAMLNSRELKIAELKASKETFPGYGRVFMSFDMKTAYFQYAELPQLPEGKTYHLWADISGSTISLGEFTSQSSVNYQPLPKLPVIDKDLSVTFLLTEEKADAAKNPSKSVCLEGKI